jgi:F0F1-type ATP synthase delta subunit
VKKFGQFIEDQKAIEEILSEKVDAKQLANKFIDYFDLKKPGNLKNFVKMTKSLNDPKFRVILNQVMMAAGA